jgi:hypothetical protein
MLHTATKSMSRGKEEMNRIKSNHGKNRTNNTNCKHKNNCKKSRKRKNESK